MAVSLIQIAVHQFYADFDPTDQYFCAPCFGTDGGVCNALNTAASGGRDGFSEYTAFTKRVENICKGGSFNINVAYDGFGTYGNNFSVYANGVLIWTTGCTVASGSDTVTIPAGTTYVDFEVKGLCSGGAGIDQWSFSAICA